MRALQMRGGFGKTKKGGPTSAPSANPGTEAAQLFRAALAQAGCLRTARSLDQLAAATLVISGFLFKPSGLLAASLLTACKLGVLMTFSLRSTFAGISIAAFC
jgi:hypothetical protein